MLLSVLCNFLRYFEVEINVVCRAVLVNILKTDRANWLLLLQKHIFRTWKGCTVICPMNVNHSLHIISPSFPLVSKQDHCRWRSYVFVYCGMFYLSKLVCSC